MIDPHDRREPDTFNLPLALTSLGVQTTDNGQTAYIIEAQAGLNPQTLLDQLVMLDGVAKRIMSVDTYGVLNATGMSFSIIVKDPP